MGPSGRLKIFWQQLTGTSASNPRHASDLASSIGPEQANGGPHPHIRALHHIPERHTTYPAALHVGVAILFLLFMFGSGLSAHGKKKKTISHITEYELVEEHTSPKAAKYSKDPTPGRNSATALLTFAVSGLIVEPGGGGGDMPCKSSQAGLGP